MPLDLQAIKDLKDKQLLDLVSQQGSSLEDVLSRYAGNIRGSRENFLNTTLNPMVNKTLSNLGVQPTGAAMALHTRDLEQNLGQGLNQERFNRTNQNLGLQFDTRNKLLDESRANLQSQNDFSKNTALTSEQQAFEAQQAEKEREFQLALDQMRDQYSVEGLDLADQYAPQTNYEAALSRAFGSLAGMGVSRYAISKAYPQIGQTPVPQVAGTPGALGSYDQFYPPTAGIRGLIQR